MGESYGRSNTQPEDLIFKPKEGAAVEFGAFRWELS